MDVWAITLAALRRWYILLPLLGLTGWGAYVAGEGVAPEYEVRATALITPGREPQTTPNPYGGIDQANAAVAIVLNSTDTRDRLVAEGFVPGYEVTTESRSSIMVISVRGHEPGITVRTGEALLEAAAQELDGRQAAAGVPPSSRFGIQALAEPTLMDVVHEGKTRLQAIVGVVGAGLALTVAVLFDDIVGLVRRRRALARRRSRETLRDDAAPVHAGEDARSEDPRADAGPPVEAAPVVDHDRAGRAPVHGRARV